MILRLILIAGFMVLGCFSAKAALSEETRFFSALNDLPLMQGLYELTDENLIFDKPEGRIVESSAASETKNPNEIKAFYDSALPQLGWTQTGPESYVRDGETLHLRLDSQGNLSVLRVTVSPR